MEKVFEALVVPTSLTQYVLHLAHDALGQNGTMQIYHDMKILYYWQGLCSGMDQHVKRCLKCRQKSEITKVCKSSHKSAVSTNAFNHDGFVRPL